MAEESDNLKKRLESLGYEKEEVEEILRAEKMVSREREMQLNLGKLIVDKFKEINGLSLVNSDLTKEQVKNLNDVRNFNNLILKDDMGRRDALQAQGIAIEEAEEALLKAKLATFNVAQRAAQIETEALARKTQLEGQLAVVLEKRAAQHAKYSRALEKEATLAAQRGKVESEFNTIRNNRLAIEARMAAIQAQLASLSADPANDAIRNRLLAEQSNFAQSLVTAKREETSKQRELTSVAKEQAKAGAAVAKQHEKYSELLGTEATLTAEIGLAQSIAENALEIAIREAREAVKAAEERLAFEQKVNRELIRGSGYMAFMKGAQYEMLGPAAGIANSFVKFSKDVKVIPIQFMILSQLLKLGIERFVALDKAAEEFRKETGFTNTQMESLRKNAESVNKELAGMGVSIEKAYKAASALTEIFNRTSLVTKEAMKNVAMMAVNLGVAEADSAEVLSIFQGLGGATQDAAFNVMKVGAGLSEKTGVSFSKVMNDIAKSSGTTAMLLGTNPSKLMKAAIAARALGTDLNTIAAQQEKLLNYTDSINNELEASALLGRSISFQRARQLAYEGKVEESARATLDMVKQAGDFNEMSIYQRKALAAAAGMELKDLTKMMAVEKQKDEIRKSGTPEQKKQLEMQEAELKKLRETADLTKGNILEENKRAIAQAKIQGLMTQMNNLLEEMKVIVGDVLEPLITPLVKVLIPVLKVVGFLVKVAVFPFKALANILTLLGEKAAKWADETRWVKSLAEWISNATVSIAKFYEENKVMIDSIGALVGGGLLVKWFFGAGGVSGLMGMIRKPFSLVKDIGTNALDKMTGKGAADAAKTVAGAGDAAKGAAETAKGVASASSSVAATPPGMGARMFLTNLAAGLTEMGTGKVFVGALNLIPASIGLIAMIPGFLGAKLLESLNGPQLFSNLLSLSLGLTEMGTARVAAGSAILILAGVGFAAMTIGALGLGAVALLGTAAGAGLIGLAAGIAALAVPPVPLGVLMLLGISAAFIGIGYAVKLASEGFVNIAKAIPEAIGPMMAFALVSPLLYLAALGIGALAGSLVLLAGAAVPAVLAAAGIYIVAKAVEKIGNSFDHVAKGASLMAKSIPAAINPIRQFASVNVKDAAQGILMLSNSLASFGIGSAAAGIGSFIGNFLGGDPIAKMERLAGMSEKLKDSASAISQIATATSRFSAVESFAKSVGVLADSLNKLTDSLGKIKTEELSKLNVIANATNATNQPAPTTQPTMNTTAIEAKLDKLTELLVGGAIRVYMDGKNVSSAVANNAGR